MKKNFRVVALMVLIMSLMMVGCGSNEVSAEPIRLTQNSSYEGYVAKSTLETEEGIKITCSENYEMGHESGGQFCFNLAEAEYQKEEYLEEDYDWNIEFTSDNAKIVKVDYYDDYVGELIGSENIENNRAIIDQEYNGRYCDSVIIYIEDGGKLYTAHFYRTGL